MFLLHANTVSVKIMLLKSFGNASMSFMNLTEVALFPDGRGVERTPAEARVSLWR